MADIDKNPATLLAELAALDPLTRSEVASPLQGVAQIFAGVPDCRDTALTLRLLAHFVDPRLAGADPASNQTGWDSEQLGGS